MLPRRTTLPRPTFHTNTTLLGRQYPLHPRSPLDVLRPGHHLRRVLHGCNRHDHRAVRDQLGCGRCHIPGCGRFGTRTGHFLRGHLHRQVECRVRNHRGFSCFQCFVCDWGVCLQLSGRGSATGLVAANEGLYFLGFGPDVADRLFL